MWSVSTGTRSAPNTSQDISDASRPDCSTKETSCFSVLPAVTPNASPPTNAATKPLASTSTAPL